MLLLDCGAEVDSRTRLLEPDSAVNAPRDACGQSPVHLAAQAGHPFFLLWQLKAGADLNQQDQKNGLWKLNETIRSSPTLKYSKYKSFTQISIGEKLEETWEATEIQLRKTDSGRWDLPCCSHLDAFGEAPIHKAAKVGSLECLSLLVASDALIESFVLQWEAACKEVWSRPSD